MPLPLTPFSTDHSVSELVQFVSALRDALFSLDGQHSVVWIRGWEKCLDRHVFRAVRSSTPQGPRLKSLISEAFGAARQLLNEGRPSPETFQPIIRSLNRQS